MSSRPSAGATPSERRSGVDAGEQGHQRGWIHGLDEVGVEAEREGAGPVLRPRVRGDRHGVHEPVAAGGQVAHVPDERVAVLARHADVGHEGDAPPGGQAGGQAGERLARGGRRGHGGRTGGSGGGLLTNWTVGQTTRFAAAVSQRDIADWADWWYTADFTLFQPSWFKAPPFEDPEDYRRRSPITYVNKIQTPLMLILGEADWRTPTGPGGEAMFRALKYRKIPTVMVRFPNESHELSRSGQPWHRIERLQHIVGWFDKWLMGVPKPEYDIGEVTRSTTTQQ